MGRPGIAAARRRGKRGRDTRVSLPLLTPQPFLRTRLPSVARLNARAHRGVWCSKSTPLIEAELFAAESKRPAPSGRALSCAAPYARKIQGLTASQNLPDARNRAPVTPVSPRDRRESRRKGGFGGIKRGQGNHTVPLPPFAPPWIRRFSAARRRQSSSRRGHGLPLTDTAFSVILEIQSTAPPFRFLAAPERK